MKNLIIVLCLAFSAGCLIRSYYEREIVGQWYSTEWLSAGEPTGMRAWMDFQPDSTYRAVFNQSKEQGHYWIDGYKLYTIAEGADPVVVKIERMEDDTMHLELNRSGVREDITLVRGR